MKSHAFANNLQVFGCQGAILGFAASTIARSGNLQCLTIVFLLHLIAKSKSTGLCFSTPCAQIAGIIVNVMEMTLCHVGLGPTLGINFRSLPTYM